MEVEQQSTSSLHEASQTRLGLLVKATPGDSLLLPARAQADTARRLRVSEALPGGRTKEVPAAQRARQVRAMEARPPRLSAQALCQLPSSASLARSER